MGTRLDPERRRRFLDHETESAGLDPHLLCQLAQRYKKKPACRHYPFRLLKNHLLPLFLLLAGIATALPQGLVIFDNRVPGTVVAPVYGVDPEAPTQANHGNTASGTPPGTQFYRGPLLSGSGFTAQLFGGVSNAPSDYLHPLTPPTAFRTGPAAGFVVAPPLAVKVPAVREQARARLQIRVWDNQGGTVTNWLQASANPTVAWGESLPFLSEPLGGIYTPPPNLTGLQSFSLAATHPPPVAIRINFQPASLPSPPGYRPDSGLVYGDRGSGLSYGWNRTRGHLAQVRFAAASPDQRFDTFIPMDAEGGAFWELALTNGTYRVHLAAGDPFSTQAVYRIAVEGIPALSGTPSSDNPWVEGDVVVSVSDDRLTVASANDSLNNCLNFLDVLPVTPPRLHVAATGQGNEAGCRLVFEGEPPVTYEILGSVDLTVWSPLGLATNTGARHFSFQQTFATGFPQRFFRARVLATPPVLP